MHKLIYLACPYSSDSQLVMHQRHLEVTFAASKLVAQGYHIFSPITESHLYQMYNSDIQKGWDYWKEHDEMMLSRCDVLWVLMLKGWDESIGVTAEIDFAEANSIPIRYITKHAIEEGII